MAGRAIARGAAVLATVAVVAPLAGCAGVAAGPAVQTAIPLASAWHPGLFVDGHGPVGLGPSPAASASPGATATGGTDQQQLASVGLLPSDVPDGESVALAAQGTSLSVPTLHYCDGDFPSEAGREARRKVEVRDPSGAAIGVSTEAVLYATPVDAGQALDELRTATAQCPTRRTVTFDAHRLELTQLPSGDVPTSGLVPTADRVLVSTEVHDLTAKVTYRLTGVYQVRGRVLCVAFLSSAGPAYTSLELEALGSLARRVAARLAALDAAFARAS